MKVLRTATIWMWWCVMMYAIIAMVMISSATTEVEVDKEVSKQLGASYTTVTFKLSTGISGYEQFMNTLRNTIGDTRSCDVLSTRSAPTTSQAYVLVKLQVSDTQWATLGIDAKDLYVWAYQSSAKQSGKYRARFLKDAPDNARKSLFTDSAQTNTSFGSNYREIESAAGTTRENIALTFTGLENDVRSVSGSSVPSRQAEATFFLRSIQLVAEGARFRLIQRAIHSGGADDKTFRTKLQTFENNWDKISQKLHQASPQCQTPIQVDNGIIFDNKTQITKEMGILKYKTAKFSAANINDALLLADE